MSQGKNRFTSGTSLTSIVSFLRRTSRVYLLGAPLNMASTIDYSKIRNSTTYQRIARRYRRYLKPNVYAVLMHPDRAIGISALFMAIFLGASQGFNSGIQSATVISSISLSLAFGLIFTLPSLRLSPDLYCKVIIASDPGMEFIFQRLIDDSETALKKILVTLDVASVGHHLDIIEVLKIEVARKLGIDSKAFCDIILCFSPQMVRRRIVKLQENTIELSGVSCEDRKIISVDEVKKYSRPQRISLQNKQIIEYLEQALQNLSELRSLPINWSEFAKFCRSPSSSSALIRYQVLLCDAIEHSGGEAELRSHVKKLYHLQNILQGTSAHALLYGVNQFSGQSGHYVDQATIRMRHQILRLPLENDQHQIDLSRMPWKKHPSFDKRTWISDASNIVMHSRTSLYDLFEDEVRYQSGGKTTYIMVDGYSRAVRVLLKLAIDKIENTEIIFLSYGDSRRDQGLRQMAHEIIHEPSIDTDIAAWRVKCSGRIHFADSRTIMRFTHTLRNESRPTFMFLVGTGGIHSNVDNQTHTIRRGRSQAELNSVRKKLKNWANEEKIRVCAVAGAYKHKDMLGKFWDHASDTTRGAKKTFLWNVDKVITGSYDAI